MKLKEFLEVALLGKTDGSPDHLYGEELNKYKDIIKGCDEFVKCDSLEILNFPAVIGKNGKTYNVNTVKLSDLMGFKGRCYLLSLGTTPEMYDPSKMHKPVKNGAAISPTVYDPITYEPLKKILLTFSPEMNQDLLVMGREETLRNNIHKLLDDVLDKPEEYQIKGFKGVMVRGLFEVIENYDGSEPIRNTYDIDLTKSKSIYADENELRK
jgi:hypothetical protein